MEAWISSAKARARRFIDWVNMAVVFIGVDDTDNLTSEGTGRLARRLAGELAERRIKLLGVTRHQFLVDPRIPYTSHNSGACIGVEWVGPPDQLRFVMDLVREWSAEGSDPGVCVAAQESIRQPIMDWGWAATQRILTMPEAQSIARAAGVQLEPLGGTGQGIIGALAAVGLRADGNEGRFLHLPGLRELGEFTTLEELTRLGITIEHHGPQPAQGVEYRTMNWVRPRLIGGKPIWPVQWSAEHHAWIPVDRKKERPLD
jgi:hypothetical protein